MKITKIQMEKIEGSPKLLAKFSIILDNCFCINEIRLIQKDDGTTFLAFYSKKNLEGRFLNVCHPINSEFRKKIEKELKEYYDNNK